MTRCTRILALLATLIVLAPAAAAAGGDPVELVPAPEEETAVSPSPDGGGPFASDRSVSLQQLGVTENLPSFGGASGAVRITSVDNSGASRSLTMYQVICKDSTIKGRLIEYKLNFGPTVRSDWKGGVSRSLNNGCSSGYRTDTFYFPNVAHGVWARVCVDDPGPVNHCGTAEYISI